MKKPKPRSELDDDLRPEYDFSQMKGVRGKYYDRVIAGTNLVVIQPDVFEVFPSGEAVNAALRTLMRKPRIRKIRQPNSRAARRRSR